MIRHNADDQGLTRGNAKDGAVRSTPKRAGREPIAGARFLAAVLADNVHARRAMARLTQGELAERLGWLGHTWTRATVSDVEKGARNVSVDEAFAMALVLGTTIPALLDPTGIDGQGKAPLDYGTGTPMRADIASKFVRGTVALSMPSEGT